MPSVSPFSSAAAAPAANAPEPTTNGGTSRSIAAPTESWRAIPVAR
jgi:hypothetical protein